MSSEREARWCVFGPRPPVSDLERRRGVKLVLRSGERKPLLSALMLAVLLGGCPKVKVELRAPGGAGLGGCESCCCA
jgi:hypothetical protein